MDPHERDQEIEELGQNQLRTDEEPEPGEGAAGGSLSPSSQIGRAAQSGGTPESGAQPGDEAEAGWPMPDQSDTPTEWPEPATDG